MKFNLSGKLPLKPEDEYKQNPKNQTYYDTKNKLKYHKWLSKYMADGLHNGLVLDIGFGASPNRFLKNVIRKIITPSYK